MKQRISFPKLLRIVCSLAGLVILIIAMIAGQNVPLHQRVLVQGVGIDRTDSGYQVTVQAASTSASASVEIYQADGVSVYDALNNITLVSGKSPFYNHNSIIIFGRSCGEAGLNDVMDFFIRHHQTRPAENIFFAKEKAADLLTLKTDAQLSMNGQQLQTNQYVLAQQIEQLASAGNLDSQLLKAQVADVATALYGDGRDAALPVLVIQEGKEIAVEGCAVFRGDRLAGMLDRELTSGMKAVNNKLTGGAVTVDLTDKSRATLSFLNSSCKVQSELREGTPHFSLSLTCSMNIDEITHTGSKPMSPEDFQQINEASSKKIQAVVERAIETSVKEYHSDVMSFSTTLMRQQTAWWKQHHAQWSDVLPSVTYDVTVDATVASEGQEMSPQAFTTTFPWPQ